MAVPAKPLEALHNALQKFEDGYDKKLEAHKEQLDKVTLKIKLSDVNKITTLAEKDLQELGKTRDQLGKLDEYVKKATKEIDDFVKDLKEAQDQYDY